VYVCMCVCTSGTLKEDEIKKEIYSLAVAFLRVTVH